MTECQVMLTARAHRVVGLAFAVALLLLPAAARACLVGTSTAPSCTEAALDACLPAGGGFDGSVTFSCGGSASITVTGTILTQREVTGACGERARPR